jgi:hypothetical protein
MSNNSSPEKNCLAIFDFRSFVISCGLFFALNVEDRNLKWYTHLTFVIVREIDVHHQSSSLSRRSHCNWMLEGVFSCLFHSLGTPVNVQLVYSSELTEYSPTYYRDCQIPNCHYETLEINVMKSGLYVLWSNGTIPRTYGYIYKNDFNPLKPSDNLVLEHDGHCNNGQFKLIIDLQINIRYVLVVTTDRPNIYGSFSVSISGPNNVTLTHFSKY